MPEISQINTDTLKGTGKGRIQAMGLFVYARETGDSSPARVPVADK
jgi:hypothetical protein